MAANGSAEWQCRLTVAPSASLAAPELSRHLRRWLRVTPRRPLVVDPLAPRQHVVRIGSDLGSGRIAASEREAPNMFVNLVYNRCAVVQTDNATEPYPDRLRVRQLALRVAPPPEDHAAVPSPG
jgi:hypothetical protein